MSDDTPAAVVTPTFAPPPGAPVSSAVPPTPAAAEPTKTVAPTAEAPKTEAPKADAPAAPKRLITEAPAVEAKTEAKPEAKTEAPKADAKATDWKLEPIRDSLVAEHELTALESYAKKAGLSKEQAQTLVAQQHEFKTAEIARTNDLWFEQSNADAEIGGAKMPQTIANVQKALAAYATPDERKAIANSPFANNPLFLRILNRAAAGLPTEDRVHANGSAGAASYPSNPNEAAATLYSRYNR